MQKFKSLRYIALSLIFLAYGQCKENKIKHKSGGTLGVPTYYKNTKGVIVEKTAVISTKFGSITIRFFPDIAPGHVDNFIKLTEKGFYNGTTFHRVIPGFMIQGGDPNSKDHKNRMSHGTGGPGYSIPAEFSEKSHKRGIASMARSNDPNSAGSQFFICVADAPHLDGQYSAFGEVLDGMDVVDKIVSVPKDGRDNPLEPVEVLITIQELPKKDVN
ncbi:MAG: peptidylprolyl isomerase [Spirochaetia bacterium]|nr:peptidylprolyl isomerase [Spirochaetia bacterium]